MLTGCRSGEILSLRWEHVDLGRGELRLPDKLNIDATATRERLDSLGVAHAGESLDQPLTDAVSADLAAHAFLDQLLRVEQESREERRIQTSLRLSNLPTGQTLENFDFAFQLAIERFRIDTVAAGAWIRGAEIVLLLGPPGGGNSHLCVASRPQGRPTRLLGPVLTGSKS